MISSQDDRHLRAVGSDTGSSSAGAGAGAYADAAAAAAAAAASADQAKLREARRAALWVGLVVPLIVTSATVVSMVLLLPRMPDPAATHWSGGDGPDGFGAAWTFPVIAASLGIGIPLVMWAFARFGGAGGAMPVWSGSQRFMAAFSLGTTIFLQGLLLVSMAVQLDVSDARDVPGIDVFVAIGFATWAIVTVAAWFAQPRVRIARGEIDSAAPLELAHSERAVWVHTVRASGVFIGVVSAAALLTAGGGIWMLVLNVPLWWLNVGIGLLLSAAMLMLGIFRVRADATGIEVRSKLGWPVFAVPASDIKSVTAAQISPLGEFGGWGLRWMPDRFGVVLRSGDGIVIQRRDGRVFAVTVDDAETGAAVLAAASHQSPTEVPADQSTGETNHARTDQSASETP
ncbi:hypothetical protein ACFWHR_09685 [Leucobacter sp. NPDC058333]|uniref:hypothetical protein n=1 Tax=Leucobacter sp. NPDC058333 TaxID=3346450 RepID=UPI003659C952